MKKVPLKQFLEQISYFCMYHSWHFFKYVCMFY